MSRSGATAFQTCRNFGSPDLMSRSSRRKKAVFLITMRTKKSFDSILFVSTCVDILEILVKKAEFLSTMRAIKSFDTILFYQHVLKFQKLLLKRAEFLSTMRAIKSFDTILFVSACLKISEIPDNKG